MRILLILLLLLIPINSYAFIYTAEILEQWTYKTEGNTPSRGCTIVTECANEASCACHVKSVQDDFKPEKNAIISQIWVTEARLNLIKADSKYKVLWAEKVNDDRSPIEPTPILGCIEDNSIKDKTTCEKTCTTVDEVKTCYTWGKIGETPYPHPEGKDKPVELTDTVTINNYLGTSLNLTGKTREEAVETLIPIVKGFKAKQAVIGEGEIVR